MRFLCEKSGDKGMSTGLIAIFIILFIIVGAISTKKCVEFLIAGSLLGAVVMYKGSFLTQWCTLIQSALADNVWIIVVCGLFGSLIALLQAAKGSLGFAKLVDKLCNTEKIPFLRTFILVILICVDDYLNVLSIGVCIKGVFDKKKIPRDTLAYMLDSTAAPVCVLLPFSTWAAFYASLFFEQDYVANAGFSSGMSAYIRAIPFCFYPIITLVIVLLFAFGMMPKLGGMKKAYQRVAETGKVYSDASRKYNHEEYKGYEEDGNIWDFLIPMGVLVGVCIVTSDVLVAVVLAVLACFIIYVPRKVVKFDEFFNTVAKGFADMIPVLILLVVAFAVQAVTQEMGLAEYIIEHMTPLLSAATFPVLTFILVAALGFTTGSFWGMCAVVTPIVFPLAAALGANPVLVMGAIASGGAFGSHACFYGDATVLASTGACIDNMEHTVSQLPYVLIASAVTVVGYLVCGFVM